ncbi:MAG TPA: sigma-70 family RNA polymerase sigma factor [Blastocatellia bacterium]|nr:sigma-70 family RNA polymerase sigma factor [Blastocatellia bacterium]
MRRAAEKSLAQLDDHELAARCLNGEEEAWEALVFRYQRLVYSIALRHGFQEDAASDVFQSVWMRLLEHLPALNDRSKLASWLITTATRECWRVSHKHRREAPIGEGGEEELPARPEVVDHRPLAEEEQLQLEQQQQLRQAVGALPDRCRNLVELLYYAEDRPSYDEISRRLEIPVPSIGPTRARCLAKLKKLLEDTGHTR